MLSASGGALGLLIGIWAVRIFNDAMGAYWKPAYMNFSMDYKVFGYLAAISIITGVIAGFAPAMRLARLDVNTALKDGGHGSTTGRHGKQLSSLLVITEIALSGGAAGRRGAGDP